MFNYLRSIVVASFILLCTQSSFAQFNNTSLFNNIPDTLEKQGLYLHINNLNFIRNYEYFNAFQDGYTMFGTILEPQLHYAANENLIVTIGAFLRKDFGDNSLHSAKPLFNLKYHKNNLSLSFGSLEGNVQRSFIEPLYDIERRITDPVEYGAQFTYDHPAFDLNAWIAWDKMIYKYSTDQEQITGGLTGSIKLMEQDYHKFSVPVQTMIRHRGGQIDVNQTAPLSTILNAAVGLKYSNLFRDERLFKRFFTENYFVTHRDQSPVVSQTFKSGNGVWLNAGLDSKFGTIIASYWGGQNFESIKGTPIYQSVSSDIDFPNYTESNRSLLLLRYAYQKPLLPNLFLDFRFEPILDLNSPHAKKIDFSTSLFLTYKDSFRLFKLRK